MTSSLRHELQVSPSENRVVQLTLENTGDASATATIVQVDFLLDDQGDLIEQPLHALPTSNAAWLEVASQVEVPARSTIDVPVTLQVPRDAERGSYWSMLMVQPVGTTVEQERVEEGVRTSVTVSFRFGVTLITHVGQPAEQNLLFRDPGLTHDEATGTHTFSVTIDNPSHFLASTEAWLELYDAQGNMVSEVQAGSLRIYPGMRRRHTFDVGTLDEQAYQAVIIVDAGRDDVFGVRYDLDLGSQ
ncbi:MAG: hypothetical protein WD336_05200 [Trueperaceae bacterium]